MVEETEMNKPSIMAHCVCYFPDRDKSLAIARGLVEGGASILEVQFPFSDPTADGPAIQRASQAALDAGFTLDRGFLWVRELLQTISLPLFIMTYGNLPFRRGMGRFCGEAKEAGVHGLIVPDLLPPADEGLFKTCQGYGIQAVPVISPGVTESRLSTMFESKPRYLYTTLRRGTTGTHTTIGEDQIRHLMRCKKPGLKVFAGFGVESAEQVKLLSPYTDYVVVGSFFIKKALSLLEKEQPQPAVLQEEMKSAVHNLLK